MSHKSFNGIFEHRVYFQTYGHQNETWVSYAQRRKPLTHGRLSNNHYMKTVCVCGRFLFFKPASFSLSGLPRTFTAYLAFSPLLQTLSKSLFCQLVTGCRKISQKYGAYLSPKIRTASNTEEQCLYAASCYCSWNVQCHPPSEEKIISSLHMYEEFICSTF